MLPPGPNLVESVEDEEFFEFEEVESIMNADEEESIGSNSGSQG